MTTSDTTEHPPFEWIGGRICLDFANTVTWAGTELLNERLGRYGDLVEWAEQAEILTRRSGPATPARRPRRPARPHAALSDAHALRKAIHDVVGARAEGREPERGAADTLNRFLGRALGRLRLGVEGDACSWVFVDEGDELDRMLWPVAWSAASLLTSDDAPLVRRCASERCGWLFVDRSRNRSRRWCDMKSCGNSAKARRHYARKGGRDAGGLERACASRPGSGPGRASGTPRARAPASSRSRAITSLITSTLRPYQRVLGSRSEG